MKNFLKRFLAVYLCLCIVGTIGVLAAGNEIYEYSLLRKNKVGYTSVQKKRWIAKNGENIYITSEDGLKLHGHLKENPESNGKYAIICHGGSGNATTVTDWTKGFYNMGFSVLCPNARAHGRSEGNVKGMGYLERRDIVLWANEIIRRNPSAQILLFGISVGGSTVLFASGENDLPENVKAVVSDCAFTTVYKEFGNILRRHVSFLPDFPIVDGISLMCKIRGGYSFREASCVEAVKKSKTPTLFIHGNADTKIPFDMLEALYDNASCPKQKLVIEGADHVKSHSTDPELYWRTIESFVKNNFM